MSHFSILASLSHLALAQERRGTFSCLNPKFALLSSAFLPA